MSSRLCRMAALGLLVVALVRSAHAQATVAPPSLAQSLIEAAASYGRHMTSANAEVLVHDASFIAEFPAAEVRGAVEHGPGGVRITAGTPLVVCGAARHSCHLTTSGVGVRLVKLQRDDDQAVAEVAISRTLTAAPNRSDVMFTMVRFTLQRLKGEWRCVVTEELFTT